MKNKQADLLGIASAVLCIIHCLLVPFFILYGLVSESVIDRWEYLDWGFVLLSGLAVYLATRHENDRHEDEQPENRRQLPRQMWAVWLVFTITLLLHDVWAPALYISVLSSVGLVWLHFQHFRKKHITAVAK
ncbi:MerC domain-containing protein [Tunicatimonas pelagia]|uniref:MerC domain-containing protein n=1 Tax=Tunicatimonas pelagia TaxID=931531 RepID=UPI002665FB9D|nr:MerC domain-containing protein [Tunicatimonas pelagia]WKN42526.1 MerC domain-containing protein [Tunicatimonas pelagia]